MRTFLIKYVVSGGGYEYILRHNTLSNVIKYAKKLKALAVYTLEGEVVFEN